MPLKLSLKPGETFVVNGAVVRNGERRGVLLLENRARVLREKDIMMPEQAVTPPARAYFAIMQMYLTGETEGGQHEQACAALAATVAETPGAAETVLEVSRSLVAGELYGALSTCRKLLPAAPREVLVDG